jgi:hypothetical protein
MRSIMEKILESMQVNKNNTHFPVTREQRVNLFPLT